MTVSKVRILNVFNIISHTTIPFELAEEINKDSDFEVVSLTFNNSFKDKEIFSSPVYECSSNNRMTQVRFVLGHLAGGRYDIVHTHHSYSSFMVHGLIRAILKERIVFVQSIHNDFRQYTRIQKIMYATAIRRSDCVICNSESTLRSIPRKHRWYDGKFFVGYNGVDTKRIGEIVQKNKGDKCAKYILSAGRLIPQKDHRSLIQAFKLVCQKHKDVRLIVCGHGPLMTELEELSSSIGVGHKVDFRGLIEREQVYVLMANSTLFVNPSIFEGFCNANVEAMAAGACVVSTETGPMREILGNAAVLVTPGNYHQLAEVMMSLLADEERRKRLSEEAVKRAKTFSLTKAADRYKEIYVKRLSAIQDS